MGHMLRIVNALAKVGETDEHLNESMKQALDEETQQKWNSFLGGAVAEMNKKNETNLVSLLTGEMVQCRYTSSTE